MAPRNFLGDGDLLFDCREGFPKSLVPHDFLQVHANPVVWLVVFPHTAQLQGLELFRFGIEAADSFGQGQMRVIEREAISVALGFAPQRPLD
jgi:hypothetical protein